MQINIRVLDVNIETKKTAKGQYKMATVDYKDLKDGKPGSRKVMSFGNTEAAFGFISTHEMVGNEYTVTLEKIGEYWNWISIEEGSGGVSGQSGGSGGGVAGNSTASVRSVGNSDDNRQKLIVRQNALTNAVKFLEATGQKKATVDEVAGLVEAFNDIVFGTYNPDVDTGARPAPTPAPDKDDDISF
jgi:hypothetical protein